jgi:glycosyl transferase family 25
MSHNIEKIFYINLDRRTDRMSEIEEELNNMGLQFERFSAIHHNSGPVGCTMSHLAVLKLARDRGYKNVLILEDDFQFLVNKGEFESYLTLLFNNFNNFNVCFLSYNCNNFENVSGMPYIKRVFESLTSSGYIINQQYYDKLIDTIECAIPLLESTEQHWLYSIDTCWRPLQERDVWVCFNKRIGKQRPSFSDIRNCFSEYQV